MKIQKSWIILSLLSLTLSACSFFNTDKETVTKEIFVYDLDNVKKGGPIANGYQDTLTALFVKNQKCVPYISLSQYASLYATHFAGNVVSKVETVSFTIDWTVTINDEYVFMSEIDLLSHCVVIAGNLDSYYKSDDNPIDTKALMDSMDSTYEIVEPGGYYATYYYGDYDIYYFKKGKEWYFPLAFFDLTYCYDSSIYYFYNYSAIYSTKDVDNFADKEFIKDGRTYTVDSQMENQAMYPEMPSYLINHNASMFLYLMDNFYGLKEYKGIESIVKYYKDRDIYKGLYSTRASIRAQAYADALDVFDDNHTALVSVNKTWGEDNYITRRLSSGISSRTALRGRLYSKREAYYREYFTGASIKPGEGIVYSQDGKTAMYMFNNFYFASSDIFDGGDLKALYDADTFLNLIQIFETIKTKGGVENIILDISTNGGGVVGVMMKILSLISKDNYSDFCYKDGATNQIISAACKVDSNHDGVYDVSDCYGNDFNFYILTSDCSFSCGNAFPCIAQASGMAKIIGQKSGGGECAVAIHYLPNSQYVYHSSHLHLGNYDKDNNVFNGFEDGTTPDIEIADENDFYDIEKLNNLILQA